MQEPLPKVERTVQLGVSPADLWQHLVDGELASLWVGGTMTIDPRLNGKVTLKTAGAPEIFGTVEEIVTGQSITWTWRTAEGEPTQVTLRLQEVDDGCQLQVTEEMLRYEIVFVPPTFA
jgi:uncharacterized protein YndB with AHSA1/START domain